VVSVSPYPALILVIWHLFEQRSGAFELSLSLPTNMQTEKAKADFENGVLTISLPKAETVKPRTIAIKNR
jgi:HSP20 family protein